MGYSKIPRNSRLATKHAAGKTGDELLDFYQEQLPHLVPDASRESVIRLAARYAWCAGATALTPSPESYYVSSAEMIKFCEEVEMGDPDLESAIAYLQATHPGGIYVHWPEAGNGSAFLFTNPYVSRPPDREQCLLIWTTEGITATSPSERREERTGPPLERRNIALLMYMQAFPECVKDGVPPDADKQDRKRGGGKTIGAHPHIKADVRQAEVMPHLRRGHFRTLKSEKYTKKRGQVVYVRPTMVKGSAKHIVAC